MRGVHRDRRILARETRDDDAKHDQPIRRRIGKRRQENGVDHREQRCVRADPQGEDGERDERHRPVGPETAHGIAEAACRHGP